MKRRDFLLSTAALSGAMPSLADTLHAAPLRLARLDRARNAFVDATACAAEPCTDAALRVRFDAFHAADSGPVLEALRVHALFDAAGGAPSPFLVWSYRAGHDDRNSRAVAFTAPRAGLGELAIEYRVAGAEQRMRLALANAGTALLQPGLYALAGPRGDGRAADLDRFGYGGDRPRPLLALDGAPRTFDYLAFRIEPMA